MKIFTCSITERAEEGEDGRDDDENIIKEEDKKTKKTGKTKQATTDAFVIITDDCDNVLAFLNAIAVKSPQVTAAPLFL